MHNSYTDNLTSQVAKESKIARESDVCAPNYATNSMAPSGVQERETGWILPEIQHALRTTHDAALRTTHDLLQRQAAAQRGGVQDTPSTMTWGHSLDDAGQFHMTSAPSLPDYVDQRMPHTTNTPESMNNRQKSTQPFTKHLGRARELDMEVPRTFF